MAGNSEETAYGHLRAAATNPADEGWEDIPTQKDAERLLRSVDGCGRERPDAVGGISGP